MTMRASSSAGYMAAGKRVLSKRKSLGGSGTTISDAIKRPGELTADVGGKPSQHLDRVRALAQNGTPLQKKEAQFYLNVLAKTPSGRKAA